MLNIKDELLNSVLELQAENKNLKFKNEKLTQELMQLKEKFGRAGRKSKLNSEQKEEIKYLYSSNTATMDEIAKNYGCSKALIHKIIHEGDEKAQSQSQIMPIRHVNRHREEVKPEPISASRTSAEVWKFLRNNYPETAEIISQNAALTFSDNEETAQYLMEYIEDCVKYMAFLKSLLNNPEKVISSEKLETVRKELPLSEINGIFEFLEYVVETLGNLDEALESAIDFIENSDEEN